MHRNAQVLSRPRRGQSKSSLQAMPTFVGSGVVGTLAVAALAGAALPVAAGAGSELDAFLQPADVTVRTTTRSSNVATGVRMRHGTRTAVDRAISAIAAR